MPYSNALQCRRRGGGAYFVGPLARWNINADRATPEVAELASETGIAWPCKNPYVGIVVRALETVLCGRGGDPIDRISRAARGSVCSLCSRGPARARGSRRRPEASSTIAMRPTRPVCHGCHDHTADKPEPAADGRGSDPLRPVGARSFRGPGCLAM